MPRPREGEKKPDYMERCKAAGHTPDECSRYWKEGPAATATPEDGEDYSDFIERCQEAGGSEASCERAWDNYEGKAARPAMALKYRRVVQAFYSEPWAVLPAKLLEIRAFVNLKAAGGNVTEEEVKAITAAAQRPAYPMSGRVAVLPLFGVLAQRMNLIGEASGGTSTEEFGAAFDAAMMDREVRSICIVADSPGGSVNGVPALADKIFAARGTRGKQIVAIADNMAASAAYWIASQAEEVYCAPGGLLGSIGVLYAHTDISAAEEQAGQKTTLITAGKYKAEGSPYGPLDKDAREALQATVDQYYGMFVGAVARGRNTTEHKVKQGYGQGRVLADKAAVAAGLADRVLTLEALLGRLQGEKGARAEDDPKLWAHQQRLRMLEMEN